MDKFHPVSTCIGLINSRPERTLKAYLDWQNSILDRYEMNLEASPSQASFEEILKSLLPLTAPVPIRFAFIPTNSQWTAYFDNSRTGTNAATVMPVLAERLGCEAVRAVMVLPSKLDSGELRYEANIFESYSREGIIKRSVFAANDGGTWKFGQSGTPYSFEEIAAYSADRISDRFTSERLCRYLKCLGLQPFEEDWYVPSEAWVIQKKGKLPENLREY